MARKKDYVDFESYISAITERTSLSGNFEIKTLDMLCKLYINFVVMHCKDNVKSL